MTRWVGGFPVFVDEAQGSRFRDAVLYSGR